MFTGNCWALAAVWSGPGASVGWDDPLGGGIEGGSMRKGADTAVLLSGLDASPVVGQSDARSAFGPVGGRVVRPVGILRFGAVDGAVVVAEDFTGVGGATGTG